MPHQVHSMTPCPPESLAHPLRMPALLLLLCLLASAGFSAQLQFLLPLNRTAYQTNEIINLSVVRSDTAALTNGTLELTAIGEDGSKLAFTFPVDAEPVIGGAARATVNLVVNGWLLRPGGYELDAACDGATATTHIIVYGHVRQSTYRLVHWGGPHGANMLPEGKDGMGFNIIMGGTEEPSIVAGEDIMGNCLMGGGHQHDLRLDNDWSDPNVYIGAMQRGIDRAFAFRTMPNAIGAHLHDEPGLTWAMHPRMGKLNSLDEKQKAAVDAWVKTHPDFAKTTLDEATQLQIANWMKLHPDQGIFGDHDIAPQRAAYQRAFGEEAIYVDQVDPKNPAELAQWTKVNDFKLGFMDAFWKASEEALSRLKPGYLAVTQSQYGWSALYDGYYFNVARSMPVISGHGGYNDFGLRNMNPSLFLEMSLPRQLDKPNWYLPEWYGNSTDSFREEHNLSFITGIQGMSTPPGLGVKSAGAPGITESNRLFARVGTIFTHPAYTNQDLTILYSKSNAYYNISNRSQVEDFFPLYMATRLIQYPIQVVLDEDVLDGTIANHKAVVVAGVNYLDPAVITGLENFIANGGVVLTTKDTTVTIKGAEQINALPSAPGKAAAAALKTMKDKDADKLKKAQEALKAIKDKDNAQEKAASDALKTIKDKAQLQTASDALKAMKDKDADQEKKPQEAVKAITDKEGSLSTKIYSFYAQIDYATPTANALKAALRKHGIMPAYTSDLTTVAAGKQVRGEIEYLFAVNYTPGPYDEKAYGYGTPAPAKANLGFADDGRSSYDVIAGSEVKMTSHAKQLILAKDFIPGEMLMLARTARPIGGVQVSTPTLDSDLTRESSPVNLDFSATLMDKQNGVLAGAAPLQITVADPLNVVRYDLYRATDNQGVAELSLPLAANDPAGSWTVTVKELISGTTGKATFTYQPKAQCGALAGAVQRAVVFPDDIPQIYRVIREHRQMVVVAGTSDFSQAAADRLVQILKPYDVTVTVLPLAEALKPRPLTDEEAATWCGDMLAGALNDNARKNAVAVGFNLPTETILVGSVQDNPLIKRLADAKVLPYAPTVDFPGRGHGMVAWNLMALGHDVETLACIGNDAEGVNQAVGTLFQIGIGIDPLTPYRLPVNNTIAPATKANAMP